MHVPLKWACMACLAAALLPAPAQSTNRPAPAGPDFSSFKVIPDRNIFNPHRYGAQRTNYRPRSTPKRTDSFTLVGVLRYEKGPFAFFEGTRSEYQKVLQPTQSIAGFTLTQVAPASVKLLSGSNEFELHLGMQLRRQDEGEWQVSSGDASFAAPLLAPSARPVIVTNLASAEPGTTSETEPQVTMNSAMQTLAADPSTEDGGTNAVADSAGTDDPVLRRLMQRREQEMNR